MINGEIKTCEFGDTNSRNYILLVGGSRLAHWEPFFTYLGQKNGFKVVTAVKNGCSFGYNPKPKTDINHASCEEWNSKVKEFILNLNEKPLAVVTKSSRQGKEGEFIPKGYIENVESIISEGVPVIGIRDNPTIPSPMECLWRDSSDVSKCSQTYESSFKNINPAITLKKQKSLQNFYPVSFVDVLCDKGECPAYFDGYPTMTDGYHYTRSFIDYMSLALEKSLNSQIEGANHLSLRKSLN